MVQLSNIFHQNTICSHKILNCKFSESIVRNVVLFVTWFIKLFINFYLLMHLLILLPLTAYFAIFCFITYFIKIYIFSFQFNILIFVFMHSCKIFARLPVITPRECILFCGYPHIPFSISVKKHFQICANWVNLAYGTTKQHVSGRTEPSSGEKHSQKTLNCNYYVPI
jgi:hypothetical protein